MNQLRSGPDFAVYWSIFREWFDDRLELKQSTLFFDPFGAGFFLIENFDKWVDFVNSFPGWQIERIDIDELDCQYQIDDPNGVYFRVRNPSRRVYYGKVNIKNPVFIILDDCLTPPFIA